MTRKPWLGGLRSSSADLDQEGEESEGGLVHLSVASEKTVREQQNKDSWLTDSESKGGLGQEREALLNRI